MPGDPKECRRRAYECIRLAQQATTHRARKEFLALADTWLRLAVIFEEEDAALKCGGDTKSNVIPLRSRRRCLIRLKAS
jgi:hypothetical protein